MCERERGEKRERKGTLGDALSYPSMTWKGRNLNASDKKRDCVKEREREGDKE